MRRTKKLQPKPGVIYVVLDENKGYYKIGKTTRKVNLRFKEHRTANPTLKDVLCLPVSNPSGAEARLKNHFETLRVQGTAEWFEFNPGHIKEIEHLLGVYERDWPLEAEADRLKQAKSLPEYLCPTTEDEELVREYRLVDQEKARTDTKWTMLRHRIMVRIGPHAGLEKQISWESCTKMMLDKDALEDEQPAIYKQYSKESQQRALRLL
jgi:hypothetical protein